MRQRRGGQLRFHLEQKHQPVRLARVAEFADQPGQMQLARRDDQSHFLMRLAARAGVGGLAEISLQLAAARTPEASIRVLRAFEQQHLVAFVEAIEQGRNFVGQRHGESAAFKPRRAA